MSVKPVCVPHEDKIKHLFIEFSYFRNNHIKGRHQKQTISLVKLSALTASNICRFQTTRQPKLNKHIPNNQVFSIETPH